MPLLPDSFLGWASNVPEVPLKLSWVMCPVGVSPYFKDLKIVTFKIYSYLNAHFSIESEMHLINTT